jgi:predicted ester cyclase
MDATHRLKADFFDMYDSSLNRGEFEMTRRLCTPDVTFIGPNGVVAGVESVIALIKSQRAAFDDFRYEVEFIFANDEGVGVISVTRGRHARPLFGIPASGRPVEIRMMSIHRIVDGRSVGGWTCSRYVEILRENYEAALADGTLPAAS